MNPFKGKKRRSADPREVADHLGAALLPLALEDSEESLDRAAAHVAADLAPLDHETLAHLAGLLLLERAAEQAEMIRHLLDGAQEPQEPTDGPETPQALQEDHEPIVEPQKGAEWAEDRR